MLRRVAGARGERGTSVIEYVALGALAVILVAGLVTAGLGRTLAAGTARVTSCVVQDRTGCAARTDALPSGGAPRTDAPRKKGGGCHGFWGCTWSGAKNVGGGAWSAVKDTGSGFKSLVTTNPVTTGRGLGTYVWRESPVGQGIRAWKACGAGRYAECGDAVFCATTANGCLVRDMVIDDKTRDDLAKGHWGDASGRVLWNGGSLLIPTKIPGLSKLGGAGKAAKGAEDAGDAAKGVRRSPPNRGGALASKPYRDARKELRNARRDRGSDAHLTYSALHDLAASFEDLSPAERTRFLGGLTPSEVQDLVDGGPALGMNLRSDVLAAAPEHVLDHLDTRPALTEPGGWYTFDGDLWRDTGPARGDVEQGDRFGDCWCLASAEAVAEQAPERIQRLFHKNANGTYTITFTGRRVTVTPELPRNGAHVGEQAGWPALLEKAFAENFGGYDVLNRGGDEDEALYQLLGGRPGVFRTANKTMPDTATIAGYLRDHDALVLGVDRPKITDRGERGIRWEHDYAVIAADPEAKTITVANPYGPSSPEVVLTEEEFRSLTGFVLTRARTAE